MRWGCIHRVLGSRLVPDTWTRSRLLYTRPPRQDSWPCSDISSTRLRTHTHTHTQTHTRTCLTALLQVYPGEPVPEAKPIWILLKQETVRGSGISWAVCKSAPRSRQITTPAPHHSVFFTGRMPFLPPNQQRQSTEGQGYVI